MTRVRRGLAIAAMLALGGCGSDTAAPEDKVEIAKADGDATRMTFKSGDGETKVDIGGASQSWPRDLPDHTPAYPGGTVTATMTSSTDGKVAGMVAFTTDDPPADVIDFYAARLKAAGFGETSDIDAGGTRVHSASAKDGRGVAVQVSAEGGQTSAAITFSGG